MASGTERAFHPVTSARWDDLAALFAANGNPNYCWCQRWRLPSGEYAMLSTAERRAKLLKQVEDDVPIGLLAYQDGEPVGWCSVAPRETYQAVERSRVIARGEGEDVWSIVCLFIARTARGKGLTGELLEAAARYARENGASTVEGYPVLDRGKSYRWMGSERAFKSASFVRAGEPSNGRVTMRRLLD